MGNVITDYTNSSGNKIRFTEQTPSSIKDSITKKLNKPKNQGELVEAKVADYIQKNTSQEINAFGQKVNNMTTKQPAGDIDIGTNKYIIEAKKSISAIDSDMKQLDKYTNTSNPNYLNYDSKKIIYYIDETIDMTNPGTVEKINKIKESGAIVVNSLEELGEVMK